MRKITTIEWLLVIAGAIITCIGAGAYGAAFDYYMVSLGQAGVMWLVGGLCIMGLGMSQ